MMMTQPTTYVASDLEGTITAGSTWYGMRKYLAANGRARDVQRLTLRSLPSMMLMRLGLVNDRRVKERWILELLGLFRGTHRQQMDAMAIFVHERELWPKRRPAIMRALRQHGQDGARILVVTGLFQPILDRFIRRLRQEGIPADGLGTEVVFSDDLFCGRTAHGLNVGPRKVERLNSLVRDGTLAVAYGDTWRDVPMLSMSSQPVAVYPDRRLRREAERLGWDILEDANS